MWILAAKKYPLHTLSSWNECVCVRYVLSVLHTCESVHSVTRMTGENIEWKCLLCGEKFKICMIHSTTQCECVCHTNLIPPADKIKIVCVYQRKHSQPSALQSTVIFVNETCIYRRAQKKKYSSSGIWTRNALSNCAIHTLTGDRTHDQMIKSDALYHLS